MCDGIVNFHKNLVYVTVTLHEIQIYSNFANRTRYHNSFLHGSFTAQPHLLKKHPQNENVSLFRILSLLIELYLKSYWIKGYH